jgi:hypothetical protein
MALILPLASWAPPQASVIALLVVGFVVALSGHVVRSRTLIMLGLGLLFLCSLGELAIAYSGA